MSQKSHSSFIVYLRHVPINLSCPSLPFNDVIRFGSPPLQAGELPVTYILVNKSDHLMIDLLWQVIILYSLLNAP